MTEADHQSGDVGAVFEQTEGHNGIGGKFPLIKEKEDDSDNAEDDEAEDGGTGPGVRDAAVLKA